MAPTHSAESRWITVGIVTLVVAAGVMGWVLPAFSAEHVIHISVDGLHPGHLQRVIDAGDAPNFKRFQDEGAWTTNARTDYTHTVTLPNHTSMITGRPVLQPEGMSGAVFHGYTENVMPRRAVTLHNSRRGAPSEYIASVFDVVHDSGRSTAMYASKDKFVIYEQSYNETTGAAPRGEITARLFDPTPQQDSTAVAGNGTLGRDKIDIYYYEDDGAPSYSAGMNERFLSDLAVRHFAYVFVHYRDPDSVGHSQRWGGSAYHQAIRTVDRYLGDVFRLVDNDPALAGHTAIVLTSDHGGVDFNHSDADWPENYSIPVFVWGAGVASGDLYAMNSDTRADPGTGRPDYNASPQPIRNGGTGNLALSLLGLGPIPGSIINVKQDLRVRPAP